MSRNLPRPWKPSAPEVLIRIDVRSLRRRTNLKEANDRRTRAGWKANSHMALQRRRPTAYCYSYSLLRTSRSSVRSTHLRRPPKAGRFGALIPRLVAGTSTVKGLIFGAGWHSGITCMSIEHRGRVQPGITNSNLRGQAINFASGRYPVKKGHRQYVADKFTGSSTATLAPEGPSAFPLTFRLPKHLGSAAKSKFGTASIAINWAKGSAPIYPYEQDRLRFQRS